MKIKMPDKVAAGIAMTQEQKRIKIAEACGWKKYFPTPESIDRGCPRYEYWVKPRSSLTFSDNFRSGHLPSPPDYFNDLNAMHEAENVLRTNLDYMQLHAWNNYCQHLGFYLTDRNVHDNNCINATSSQRAEAFGKTLNLW